MRISTLAALLLVIGAATCTTPLHAQVAPSWSWAERLGNSAANTSAHLAHDQQGNTYVAGFFSGTITFGSVTLVSGGQNDSYLLKYNGAGNLVWHRHITGSGFENVYGIAVDAAGNVFLAGHLTSNSAVFGNITVPGTQASSFLAKYDASGNTLFARRTGNGTSVTTRSLATDAAGNVYLAGDFTGTGNFETNSYTSAGSSDIFIRKFDGAGTALWAKRAGGTNHDLGNGLATDAAGNVYLAGKYTASATFGSISFPAINSSSEGFVTQLDGSGTFVWARRMGGTSPDQANAVATDPSGNVLVTGLFASANAEFETTTLTSAGGADIFTAKYTSAGALLWAHRAGGTSDDQGNGLAADAAGNVYVTGSFKNSFTFAGNTLTSAGDADVLVLQYDAAGVAQFASSAGGPFTDSGEKIATDAYGNKYLTGLFQGTATFGSVQQTSTGQADVFIAALSNTGTLSNALVSPGIFCQGQTLQIPVLSSQTFNAGNVFTAELSDAAGSFANPVSIGTLTATAADTLEALIPLSTAPGSSYRVRILSSDPVLTGTPGPGGITILPAVQVSATAVTPTITEGQTVHLSVVSPNPDYTYSWSGPNLIALAGPETYADPSGTGTASYTVTASNAVCSAQATVNVQVNANGSAAPNWSQAMGADGAGNEVGNAVAVDELGNRYVIGTFEGNANFGPVSVGSVGNTDVFFAKYDATGNLVWLKRAGGFGEDKGLAIAVDQNGFSYISGEFRGSATFGTVTLTGNNQFNPSFFVAKVDPAGDVVWAHTSGNNSRGSATGVAVDAAGCVYVTGRIGGTATFGNIQPLMAGYHHPFLVKYSPSGTPLWARQQGIYGSTEDQADAIALDARANVFIGSYFLTKYDSAGIKAWDHYPTANGSRIRAITTDQTGNAYITGETNTGVSPWNQRTYISKINPTGTAAWTTHQTPTLGYSFARAIARDAAGNLYVAGSFAEQLTFGAVSATTLANSNVVRAFVLKFTPAGAPVWVKKMGAGYTNSANGIAVDLLDNIHVTGSHSLTVSFGTNTLTNGGQHDYYLATLGEGSFTLANLSTSALTLSQLCQGGTVQVPFTATGAFATGNQFKALLSGPDGSFANPQIIGTLAGTTSGTVSATIPASVVAGSGYRIKVVSTNPASAGTDNGTDIVIGIPSVTASANAVAGEAVSLAVLNPLPGVTYTWNGPGLVTATGASVTAVPPQAGAVTYSVSAAVGNCTAVGTVTPAVEATPFGGWGNVLTSGQSTGGTNLSLYARGYAIASDANGFTYATGAYANAVAFGGHVVTSESNLDMFLVKLDANSQVVWVRTYGGLDGNAQVRPSDIVVDNTGNVWVTGEYTGGYGIVANGNPVLPQQPGLSGFLMKLDPNGGPLWATGFVSPDEKLLAADNSGNVFLAAEFYNTITLNGNTLTGLERNMLVAKFSGSGSVAWTAMASSSFPLDFLPRGLVVDNTGAVYVSGDGGQPMQFGTTTYPGGAFLAKYSASGALMWVNPPATGSMGEGRLAYDAATNSLIMGHDGSGNITKYDLNGNDIWTAAVTATNSMQINAIASDALGEIYVVGQYGGTLTIGGMPFSDQGGAVFMKYSAAGELLWAKGTHDVPTGFIPSGVALPADVSVNALGKAISTGFYEGSLRMGNTVLTSAGYGSAFIVQIGDPELSISDSLAQNLCPGTLLEIPVTAAPGVFGPNNTFVAELYAPWLSITQPQVIGTLQSNTSGVITAQLPANLIAPSLGYRIQVRSTEPAIIDQSTGTILDLEPAPYYINAFAAPDSVAPGGLVTLNSGFNVIGWLNYSWSGPALNQTTTDPVTANPTLPGTNTYYVEVTNMPNCRLRDTVHVFVDPVLLSQVANWEWAVAGGSGSGLLQPDPNTSTDSPDAGKPLIMLGETGIDIVADASGNTTTLGRFKGNATFGSTTLASSGPEDLVLIRTNPDGQIQWAVKAGSNATEEPRAIALDGSGNTYICGSFTGTATFGSQTLPGTGEDEAFLVSYNASGSVNWAKMLSSTGKAVATDVVTHANGVTRITGYFTGVLMSGGNVYPSAGSSDIFVAEFTASGAVQWVVTFGGTGQDEGYAISMDDEGSTYFTGVYKGNISFGSIPLNATGSNFGRFLTKLDLFGNVLWAKQVGPAIASPDAPSIATDGSGTSYLTGTFSGTQAFSGTTLTSAGSTDAYLLRYSPAGTQMWAKRAGGAGEDRAENVTIDHEGFSQITGYFFDFIRFGEQTLSGIASADVFVAKYDHWGNCMWARKAGGTTFDVGAALATDALGNTYVAGSFQQAASFGQNNLVSAGIQDLFIAKLGHIQAVGVEDEAGSGAVVTVYPNPFQASFMVRLPETATGPVTLTLFDLLGQQLFTQQYTLAPGQTTLAVQPGRALPQGVYLLHLTQGSLRRTVRVIKQ